MQREKTRGVKAAAEEAELCSDAAMEECVVCVWIQTVCQHQHTDSREMMEGASPLIRTNY